MAKLEPKVGERYRFACRPHEEDGHVTIHRIEGDTVHVSLAGLRLFNSAGVGKTVGHLPISMSSLCQSITQRDGEGPILGEGFAEGYEHWKAAKGGVFSASLSEVLGVLERSLSEPEALFDHAIRTMRELRTHEAIGYALGAFIALPTVCFIRWPDDPSGPLLWKYEGYPMCIPVFTSEARAENFIRDGNLNDPGFITVPTNEAIPWMLTELRDEVEYAGVNDGNDLNLPVYFDMLRSVVSPES